MTKKRVSRDIRWIRHLFIPIIIILTFFNTFILLFANESVSNLSKIIIPLSSFVFLAIAFITFKYLERYLTIEFDNNFFYLTDKTESKRISLTQIVSLTMTPLKINNNYSLKITFIGQGEETEYAIFITRPLNINLTEFCETIKKVNQTAKIQTFSFGPLQLDKAND